MDCLTACAKVCVYSITLITDPQGNGRSRAEAKCWLALPSPKLSGFANRTVQQHHIPLQICASTKGKANVNAHAKAEVAVETSGDATVRVKLVLRKECLFGEQFSVVGEDPQFGSWDPQAAIPMNWSEGHIWTAELDIPVGKRIQFKFLLTGILGEIQWQPGPDRVFDTWETRSAIVVTEDWESADLQTITEETIAVPPEDINRMNSGRENKLDNSYVNDTITGVPVLVPGLETLVDAKEEEGSSSKNTLPAESNARNHTTLLDARSKGSTVNANAEVPVLATVIDCTEEDRSCSEQAVTPESNAKGNPALLDIKSKGYSLGPRLSTPFEVEEEQSASQEEILGQSYVGSQPHLLDECKGSSDTLANQTSVADGIDGDTTATNGQTSSTAESFKNGDLRTSNTNCNEGDGFNSNMHLGANQLSEDSENCQPDASILQDDFDWGRKALSKLIWSLGFKH